MEYLTDKEIARIKEVFFKWLDDDDIQTWTSAADALIKLEGMSTQESKSSE